MPQNTAFTNGRVSLRDYIELRFDALDRRLDGILPDHEDRIRSLEKREPWRTTAEVVTGIVAITGNFFGFGR